MGRWIVIACAVLTACGRVSFDPLDASVTEPDGGITHLQGYLKASNSGSGDEFGCIFAFSGDGSTLAVGARREDSAAVGIDGNQADDSAVDSGATYVFARSGATWIHETYIKPSNTGAGDTFATSMAMSADGTTLAVTSLHEASQATGIDGNQADNSAPSAGAVYVFVRAGTTWIQQAYLKASNTDAADLLGARIAISDDGNTIAVGAPSEDSAATGVDGNQADDSVPNSGAVYVFARSGTQWTQQAYVKASNTGAGDDFGRELALSGDGNTLAVGAPAEDSAARGIGGDQASNAAVEAGAIYVFTRAGTWTQQAYVKTSNMDAGDGFGDDIALSTDGSTMVIGARAEDGAATGVGGDETDNSAPDAGAVYVFTRVGATWTQRAYLKASTVDAGDEFGEQVAMSASGGMIAVGARAEASAATGIGGDQTDNSAPGAGAVYLFARAGDTWIQQAYVKAPNTDAGDQFSQVGLSADGSILVVGARYEDSGGTGAGADAADDSATDAGAIYVFE